MNNPTPTVAPVTPVAPAYRLHSAENVAIAAFFGLPMAGAWLMASNDRKLGNSSRARTTLVLGVLGTLALFAIAVLLGDLVPQGFPPYLVPIAYTVGMRSWATQTQGEAYRTHLAAAGLKASSWAALGIGLLWAVLSGVAGIGLAIAAAVLLPGNG